MAESDTYMEAPVSRPAETMPELTLSNAQKTIQFFQEEPQWLANPRTAHAANAIFGQASKIVGMGIQLDRVNAQADTARLKLNTDTRLINHLNDGVSKLKDLTVVADIREEINANGPTPRAISLLNTALDKQNASFEPQAMSMTLDDGTEVQGWVDPKTRRFTQYKPGVSGTGPLDRKPVADTLTFADGKKVNVVYGPSGAPTVIKDGKEADDAHQKGLQDVAKSDLLDARKAVHKAATTEERELALKGYDSAKRNFDAVFRQKSATPATASTNSPAASTPSAAPGYKVGGVYEGGLKYLGGDPSQQSSWQKTQ